MSKMKELTLQFKGYKIKGEAHLILWGEDKGFIEMKPTFISADKLSHNEIKRAVNDNGFGCEKITSALVDIYKCYGEMHNLYEEFDRTIVLNTKQCQDGLKGI